MEDSSATKRREKTDCKMHKDTSKKPLSRYASRKNHLQQLTPGAAYVSTDAPPVLGGTGKRVEEEEEPDKFLAPARTGLVVGSSPRKKVVRSDESPKKRWFGGRPAGKGSASANQQIRSISASYPSLNNNNNNERKRSVDDGSSGGDRRGRSKRPVTILPVKSTNVTLRRGQQPKTTTTTIPGDHHQNHNNQGATTPDDLSRSSSVTNLNVAVSAEQQHHQQNKIAASTKGAKPKKSESKDKLDKLLVVSSGNDKKHERKASGSSLSRNNNREPPPPPSQGHPPHLVEDLHQEVEILQRQLERMSNEKSSLALQLGEQTGQLNSLQTEVVKLKMLQDQASLQLEQLTEENTLLRNRLRDVAHSPLSDNEKQQLLYESHQRHHSSSAPASIATNLLDDGGDITTCPTPEWDKHSSSNVSEVSVACLQDKINQMQETHYSTNEELQATLQELTDLQRQLTELQQENERLIEEKNLMFESLCRQTERLNDSRTEVENLKQLLYKDAAESATSNNGGGQKDFESAAEREQKLVDLLKSAQEEREVLLVKQEQLDSDLKESRSTNLLHGDEIMQLKDRVRTLESTLDAKHAEHKLLDQELALARDQSSSRQIEINRLKDLLENARTKINELEQDRTMSDKSELDEILDNTRKEKDALESEVAHMKEHLALGRNEIEKLKEQLSLWQEECKVTRNNAKTTQSDLEYKVEKLMREKEQLTEELSRFQEAVNELQVQNQCQMDDKRQLSAVLSETQRNLNEAERKIGSLENELADAKRLRQEQEEEWEKFQNDLLTSVRVANDFKTEAQQDLQRMIMENKAERERVKQLEAQIDKLKGDMHRTVNTTPPARRTPTPPTTLLLLGSSKKDQRRKPPGTPPSGGNKPKKRLSKEEELLLENLSKMYQQIDRTVPDEMLSEQDRMIKTLWMIYDEEEVPKQRPVAHKPKDKLAISKPLLDSVISNKKLEKIANDPNVQSVERVSLNIDDFLDEVEKQRGSTAIPKAPSEGVLTGQNADSEDYDDELVGTRSKSLNDLTVPINNADDRSQASNKLRRFNSQEDLSKNDDVSFVQESAVTFSTLEEICQTIDPSTPEHELTKEQRLALRIKTALGERKGTLKKTVKIGRKKIEISTPIRESVVSNSKLARVLQDPYIMEISPNSPARIVQKKKKEHGGSNKDRYSVPVGGSRVSRLDSSLKSQSYDDIPYNFNLEFKGPASPINMYSESEDGGLDTSSGHDILPPRQFRDVPASPKLVTFLKEDVRKVDKPMEMPGVGPKESKDLRLLDWDGKIDHGTKSTQVTSHVTTTLADNEDRKIDLEMSAGSRKRSDFVTVAKPSEEIPNVKEVDATKILKVQESQKHLVTDQNTKVHELHTKLDSPKSTVLQPLVYYPSDIDATNKQLSYLDLPSDGAKVKVDSGKVTREVEETSNQGKNLTQTEENGVGKSVTVDLVSLGKAKEQGPEPVETVAETWVTIPPTGTDTMKKEHNYLDLPEDDEKVKLDAELSQRIVEVPSEKQNLAQTRIGTDKSSSLDFGNPERAEEPVITDLDAKSVPGSTDTMKREHNYLDLQDSFQEIVTYDAEPADYSSVFAYTAVSSQILQFNDESEEDEVTTYEELVLRDPKFMCYLRDEDDPYFEILNEEERQLRRGARRVYSQVVEEIKEKYIKSESEAEEDSESAKDVDAAESQNVENGEKHVENDTDAPKSLLSTQVDTESRSEQDIPRQKVVIDTLKSQDLPKLPPQNQELLSKDDSDFSFIERISWQSPFDLTQLSNVVKIELAPSSAEDTLDGKPLKSESQIVIEHLPDVSEVKIKVEPEATKPFDNLDEDADIWQRPQVNVLELPVICPVKIEDQNEASGVSDARSQHSGVPEEFPNFPETKNIEEEQSIVEVATLDSERVYQQSSIRELPDICQSVFVVQIVAESITPKEETFEGMQSTEDVEESSDKFRHSPKLEEPKVDRGTENLEEGVHSGKADQIQIEEYSETESLTKDDASFVNSWLKSQNIETSSDLDDDDMELLKRIRSERFSRPLSDINIEDLMMVEEMKKRYTLPGNEDTWAPQVLAVSEDQQAEVNNEEEEEDGSAIYIHVTEPKSEENVDLDQATKTRPESEENLDLDQATNTNLRSEDSLDLDQATETTPKSEENSNLGQATKTTAKSEEHFQLDQATKTNSDFIEKAMNKDDKIKVKLEKIEDNRNAIVAAVESSLRMPSASEKDDLKDQTELCEDIADHADTLNKYTAKKAGQRFNENQEISGAKDSDVDQSQHSKDGPVENKERGPLSGDNLVCSSKEDKAVKNGNQDIPRDETNLSQNVSKEYYQTHTNVDMKSVRGAQDFTENPIDIKNEETKAQIKIDKEIRLAEKDADDFGKYDSRGEANFDSSFTNRSVDEAKVGRAAATEKPEAPKIVSSTYYTQLPIILSSNDQKLRSSLRTSSIPPMSPLKLDPSLQYEPVYANYDVTSVRKSREIPPVVATQPAHEVAMRKKPMPIPRQDSNAQNMSKSQEFAPNSGSIFSSNEEHIYQDLGGTVSKTRFRISYHGEETQQKQEKSTGGDFSRRQYSVNTLRRMFETGRVKDSAKITAEEGQEPRLTTLDLVSSATARGSDKSEKRDSSYF